MKTATIPSLRVEAELRKSAEDVLREGETLSAFVEQSLKDNILRRRMQAAFFERGMAARDEAQASGEYVSAETMLGELDSMLNAARQRLKPQA